MASTDASSQRLKSLSPMSRRAVLTDVSHALLDLGYTPLPNKDKRCFYKGWSSAEVTHDRIDEWGGRRDTNAVGIRVEAPLCVIDLDIDDKETMERVADRLLEMCPELEDCPIRHSGKVSEMWFAQAESPFSRASSGKYRRGDDDLLVEVFGSGKQVAVYGAHTYEDGVVERWYDWAEGPTLLDVAPTDLPLLTAEQVSAIKSIVQEVAEEMGYEEVRPAAASDARSVYDLDTSISFHMHHGLVFSYDELQEGDRVRMQEIVGEGTNTSRGRVVMRHDGWIGIWDSETGQTHYPPDADIATAAIQAAEKLGEGMRKAEHRPPDPYDAGDVTPRRPDELDEYEIYTAAEGLVDTVMRLEAKARAFARRFVMLPGKTVLFYDILTGSEYGLPTLKAKYASLGEWVETAQGKSKEVHPVDFMIKNGYATTVDARETRPDRPHEFIINERGKVTLNMYVEPELPDVGFTTEPFEGLMRNLFPIEEDYADAMNWIAYKVQNPWARGKVMLHTTYGTQGTGRNTLFSILSGILGERNTFLKNTLYEVFEGSDNAWMTQNVLLFIPEADHPKDARKTDGFYTKFKALMDPNEDKVTMKALYQNQRQSRVFFSTIIASNSGVPISFDEHDRRVEVYNGARSQKIEDLPELEELIDAVRIGNEFKPEFLGAVRSMLLAMPTDAKAFQRARNDENSTAAKKEMTESSESIFSRELRSFLDREAARGHVILRAGYVQEKLARKLREPTGMTLEQCRQEMRRVILMLKRKDHPTGWHLPERFRLDTEDEWALRNDLKPNKVGLVNSRVLVADSCPDRLSAEEKVERMMRAEGVHLSGGNVVPISGDEKG